MVAAVTSIGTTELDAPLLEARPRLAPGVELLGPYRDSGLENPPYLIERAGRIVQISRLLHTVAAAADGTRSHEEVAAVAAVELDRPLTGDQVRFLVVNKLLPARILIEDSGVALEAPVPPAPSPRPDTRLLALRFRRAVVSAEGMDAAARRLAALFRPPAVVGVLAATAVLDAWAFGIHGVSAALRQVAQVPALMLCVLLLVWLSAVFHELGHAAGCRYSGGRPGAAGIGLYVLWPVLYTNVTSTYRLDRRGRLRTDLGGIYFNTVFTVGLGALYAVTGWAPLLVVVLIEHALVVQQLVPFVRFDGYYIVSDLTGLPDILSRIRPALVSLLPGRPTHPDVSALRPGARRALYGYLASLTVFVIVGVVPGILLLPRTVAASGKAVGPHLAAMGSAAGRWDTIVTVYEAAQVLMLSLPVLGLTLTLGYLALRAAKVIAHRARRLLHRPVRVRPVRTRPVRRWLDASGLAVVEGTDLPGGGSVDYFVFGFDGEVLLVGLAGPGRTPRTVADRLCAAAGALGSFTSDKLDRLLLEGPPFAEVVADATRRAGRHWDEAKFRSRLDQTLARGDLLPLVACSRRLGATVSVQPLRANKPHDGNSAPCVIQNRG